MIFFINHKIQSKINKKFKNCIQMTTIISIYITEKEKKVIN